MTTTSKAPRGKGAQGVRRYIAGLAPVPVPVTIAWGDNVAWFWTQVQVAVLAGMVVDQTALIDRLLAVVPKRRSVSDEARPRRHRTRVPS